MPRSPGEPAAQVAPSKVAFYAEPSGEALLHVSVEATADDRRLITRTIRGGDEDGQITRIMTADGEAGRTLVWIEGAGQDARIDFTLPLPQPDAIGGRFPSAFARTPIGQAVTHASPIIVARGGRRLTGEATQTVTITARDPQSGLMTACSIDMTITIGPSRTVTRTERTYIGEEMFTEDRTLKVFVLGVRVENKRERWSRVR